MTKGDTGKLRRVRDQIQVHLAEGIAPFWRARAVDPAGGFHTNYDARGHLLTADTEKLINTQARMVWGFTMLHESPRVQGEWGDLQRAGDGVRWLIDHFWDTGHGGWVWRTSRAGEVLDAGKLTFGQTFALYALADYARVSGNAEAEEYARRTFDVIEERARDEGQPGYLENFRGNWLPEAPERAGDVKSLDIHMHIMEAYTSLYLLTGESGHRSALENIIDILVRYMVDHEAGCGGNQYDRQLRPRLPVKIPRTWNADREEGETAREVDLSSYGHNLELGWLLSRADLALGRPRHHHRAEIAGLSRHALRFGWDREWGGVYRDGPHDGPAAVHDKEFWQNAEALPGLLEAYIVTGEDKCLEAFMSVWNFVNEHMIDHDLGEWRVLLDRQGRVIDGNLGNPWKVFYHSGRAADETVRRLDELLSTG